MLKSESGSAAVGRADGGYKRAFRAHKVTLIKRGELNAVKSLSWFLISILK